MGDCLHFKVGTYHDLFLDVEVGDFLTKPENLENNPPLSVYLEVNMHTAFMIPVPWIHSLVKEAEIVEGLITVNKLIESLKLYHKVDGY